MYPCKTSMVIIEGLVLSRIHLETVSYDYIKRFRKKKYGGGLLLAFKLRENKVLVYFRGEWIFSSRFNGKRKK